MINKQYLYLALAVFIFGSLMGCAPTTTNSFVGPMGATVHTSKCSQSPNGCYQQAALVCQGPYKVLAMHTNSGGVFADILPGPITWYNVTFSCGKSN